MIQQEKDLVLQAVQLMYEHGCGACLIGQVIKLLAGGHSPFYVSNFLDKWPVDGWDSLKPRFDKLFNVETFTP